MIKRKLSVGVTLVVSAVAALLGCAGQSDLDVLRSEPVTTIDLASAGEVTRVEHDSGETLGKPNSAIVLLRFVPAEGEDLLTVLEEARSRAGELGWALTGERDFVTGRKVTAGRDLTMELFVAPESGRVILQVFLSTP